MPSRNGNRSGNTPRGAGRPKTTRPSSDSSSKDQPENTPTRQSTSKKHKPSFDIARHDLGDTRAGWVYRSDRPPAAEVELIPPGRPALQRLARPEPPASPPPAAPALPLPALTFGVGGGTMPF